MSGKWPIGPSNTKDAGAWPLQLPQDPVLRAAVSSLGGVSVDLGFTPGGLGCGGGRGLTVPPRGQAAFPGLGLSREREVQAAGFGAGGEGRCVTLIDSDSGGSVHNRLPLC